MTKIEYPLYLVQPDRNRPDLLYVEVPNAYEPAYLHTHKGVERYHSLTASLYIQELLEGKWAIITAEEANTIKEQNKPFPRYFIHAEGLWRGYVVYNDSSRGTYCGMDGKCNDTWGFSAALSFARDRFWKEVTKEEALKKVEVWPKYIACHPSNPYVDRAIAGFSDNAYIEWTTEERAYLVRGDGNKEPYPASYIKDTLQRGHWVEISETEAKAYLQKYKFPIYFRGDFQDRTLLIKYIDDSKHQIINKQGVLEEYVYYNTLSEARTYSWEQITTETAEEMIQNAKESAENKEKDRQILINNLIDKVRGMDLETLKTIKL